MVEGIDNIQHDRFQDNCFSLVRIICAVFIAVGHITYNLGYEVPEPLYTTLKIFSGVPMFFVVSGFWYAEVVKSICHLSTITRVGFVGYIPQL